MEDFFNAEISIYSRAEFFIYLFEDLCKDFLMKPRVRRFFSKMFEDLLQKKIKCRYLHKINEKSRAGINGYFCIKKNIIMGMTFLQTFV